MNATMRLRCNSWSRLGRPSRARRALLLSLLLGPLLGAASAGAAEEVGDYLTENWFVTEVIVFQRPAVQEFNTDERLVRHEPRRYPAGIRQLNPAPGAAPVPYPLDAETEACLEFPIIDYALTPDLMPRLLAEIEAQRAREAGAYSESGGAAVTDKSEAQAAPAQQADTEAAASDAAGASVDQVPLPEPAPDARQEFLDRVATFEADLGAGSYTWLTADQLKLADAARRLTRNSGYQVLLHGAWLQPVPAREAPEPVLVKQGAELDGGDFASAARQLEGTLDVTLGRYLHFNAELWYREPGLGLAPINLTLPLGPNEPALPQPDTQATAGYMRLAESRRMRSEEIHYLDHPKIGVIVRIDPVAIPDELTEALRALQALEPGSSQAERRAQKTVQ